MMPLGRSAVHNRQLCRANWAVMPRANTMRMATAQSRAYDAKALGAAEACNSHIRHVGQISCARIRLQQPSVEAARCHSISLMIA
jgi:hypothetical protein